MEVDKLENLDETMKSLMAEYEKSGLGIDEFIVSKLKASGKEDPEKFVQEMNETLDAIDRKYADLKAFKEQGGNREEWLRKEMDEVASQVTTEEAGKVFSSATKVLLGEEDDQPDEEANYSAIDAVAQIRELENALVKNVAGSLKGEEEE